ncbi:hypothetical protein GBA52_008049 [Prunus armeniaca]|nr:hypothetical protein GBA52_008049 [Prunus armeniaca]
MRWRSSTKKPNTLPRLHRRLSTANPKRGPPTLLSSSQMLLLIFFSIAGSSLATSLKPICRKLQFIGKTSLN